MVSLDSGTYKDTRLVVHLHHVEEHTAQGVSQTILAGSSCTRASALCTQPLQVDPPKIYDYIERALTEEEKFNLQLSSG